MTKPDLCQNEIKRLFEYRDGLLIRKFSTSNRIKAGDVSGSLNSYGYLKSCINGIQYLNHRIIFFMHKGYLPKYVDHVDRDKLNNRIENLRGCDATENVINRGPDKDTTSRFKGVSWETRKGKWRATIVLHGKQTFLGLFEENEETLAALAYDDAAIELHGEFATTNQMLGLIK